MAIGGGTRPMRKKGVRILLSYHRHDIKWRDSFDKQAQPFQEKGEVHISYNEVAEGSQSFGDYQEALASFDVILLCISEDYLSLSNFIEREIPERILPLPERESRVIHVYVGQCSWQSVRWLREMRPWPPTAFSHMPEEEKEKYILRLIKDELFPRANVDTSKSTGIETERIMNANGLKGEHRLREALDAYELIIAQHPENVVAKTGRAEVLKVMGRLDESLMAYEQIIAQQPENVVAKTGRAEVLKAMGRLDESLVAYDQSIAEYPENVVAKTGRAEVLKMMGRLEEALMPYDQIIAEHPESVVAKTGRVEVLKAMGRLDESLMAYDQIIAEHPKSVVAKTGRAEVLKVMGRLEESLMAYDQIIAEHPEDVVAKTGRADMLMRLGQHSEGQEDERSILGHAYGGDDDYERVFEDNLVTFLMTEKKFPRESLNYGIVAEAPDLDLAAAHPDTDDSLAVFDCKSGHHGKPSPEVFENMAKAYKSGRVGIRNPFAYVVHRSEESNEDFVIFEVEDDGTSHEISYAEFPTYDQLLFASPLSNRGRRICWTLMRFAKDRHRFNVYTPSRDYINLQLKRKRTAAQIHRFNDSDENIALVLAGYQKDFPEVKVPTCMSKGEVEQLSGYTSKHPAEKNWLEGNIGHERLRYKAGVYILGPTALVDGEVREEIGELLKLAKENAENRGAAEPEESTVDTGLGFGEDVESAKRRADVVGNVPTMRVEDVGEKDRLGRDKLVKTLAGMFAQTECDNGFTMALLGDWGQGKSTVMGLLQAELEEKHKGKFEFATYNAWEYEKADNVAAGIAQEVVRGLLDIGEWKMPFLRARFAWREHKSSVYLFVLSLVVAIAFSLVMMRSLPLIELVKSVSNRFPNAKTLIELVTTYWPWILPILGLRNVLKKTEHPLKVGLRTYFRLPDYGKHLGLVPVLKNDISALCKLQLNERVVPLVKVRLREKKKLVVFVDDLDRCNVDHIAKVLDAIRLVMTIPNVIVMIGIDHRIAFRAIRKHYRELADGNDRRGAGEIARDYLGKIIQLPLQLRAASHYELEEYVFEKLFDKENIVDDADLREAAASTSSEEQTPDESKVVPEERTSDEEQALDQAQAGSTEGEGLAGAVAAGNGDIKEETDKGGESAETAADVTEEEITEAIKDTTSERSAFYELVGKFGFSNPRQLLRLQNSFRFLKGYGRGKGGGYDTLDILRMLFWQEFLHNWPTDIRVRCMAEFVEGVDGGEAAPVVRGVLDSVRDDMVKLVEREDYAKLAEFVRIVVLPHNEEGIFDTKEEIDEWLEKMKEKEKKEARK